MVQPVRMDPLSLQKLLISTNKAAAPFAGKAKPDLLSEESNSIVEVLGICSLCGISSYVKEKRLENNAVCFITSDKPLQFCSSCVSFIERKTELHGSLRSVNDELDAIVIGVKTVLRAKQNERSNGEYSGAQLQTNCVEISAELQDVKLQVLNGGEQGKTLLDCVDDLHVVREKDDSVNQFKTTQGTDHPVSPDTRIQGITENRTVNKYKCSVCSKPVRNHSDLQQHLATHTSKDKQPIRQCEFCLKQFKYSWNFAEHLKSHLDKDNAGKCGICGKIMSSFLNLRKHHVSRHGTQEQKDAVISCRKGLENRFNRNCEICGKSFSSRAVVKRHHISMHGNEVEKNSFKLKMLRMIENRKRKTSLKCYFCWRSFDEWPKLRKHISFHTQERLYKCSVCLKSMTTSSILYQHRVTKHGKKEDIEKFVQRRRSYHHKLMKLKKLKCYFCFKTFKGFAHLSKHVKAIHTKEIFWLSCANCSKKFPHKISLRTHQERFCSPIIEAREIYLSYLQRLKGVYENSRRACYFCGTSVLGQTAMKRHLRAHTMEKPYSCVKCRKSFAQKRSFEYHAVVVCKTETDKVKVARFVRMKINKSQYEKKRKSRK